MFLFNRLLSLKISGDGNEGQILVAGRCYLDRPGILESVLNDLFRILSDRTCEKHTEALDIILQAMERHPEEKVRLS